ncbi:MAG: antibiotic biosynthesis monooxygenase [Actinomycetota bacterium]
MSDTPPNELDAAFGMVVRFTLREGGAESFDQLMRDTVAKIRIHEPETIAYVVQSVEGEPNLRIFYELYANPAAFEHHQAQDYIDHFKAERENYVTDVQVDRLGVVTAAGAVLGQP